MDPTYFEPFEQSVGIRFNDKKILQQAFVHRSYVNEHRGLKLEHNERLEFLGDAVLELAVTDHLFHRFTDKPEGELTAFRAALVNTQTLSQAATEIGMNDYLLLSRGEAKDTGRARQFILANTFEALIGALYLDQGYDAAQRFIAEFIFPRAEDVIKKRLWQDPKSRFQEEAQERTSITPNYELLAQEGPDHDKVFEVGVYIGDEQIATGKGKSKQEAEQEAAQKALEEKGW